MSYELIYQKQFIKAEKDGKEVFFPMIYAGSSNCFEVGRGGRSGRRVRSWWNFVYFTKHKPFATMEEMIANVEEYRQEIIARNKERNEEYRKEGREDWIDEYKDEQWGYFTSTSFGGGCRVTYNQFKNLFITGCKRAATVEQLAAFYIQVHITPSYGSEEKLKAAGKKSFFFCPKTSKELIEKIEEVEEYIKGTEAGFIVDFQGSEDHFKNMRTKRFPKQKHPKTLTTVDKFFVVKDESTGNYILKGTKYGYKYSYNGRAYCKRFAKESEAKRFAKRMQEKMAHRNFVVEEVNETAQVYV